MNVNLATHIRIATEESATLLNEELRNNQHLRTAIRWSRLQNLALDASGFASKSSLQHLEEQDDSHPKVQLYYANLSLLLAKVLAQAANNMSY